MRVIDDGLGLVGRPGLSVEAVNVVYYYLQVDITDIWIIIIRK